MKKVLVSVVIITMSVMTGCVNTEVNEEITTEELENREIFGTDKDEELGGGGSTLESGGQESL